MFAKLSGTIDSTGNGWAVVDVNGVGYLVHCSSRTLNKLATLPGVVSLHVDTHVREDQITLFGFLTSHEKDWFKMLQSVQGVGGKAALAILSVLSPDEINTAIAAQDKKMITRADGVGPKLAERIVNELKSKAGTIGFAHAPSENLSTPAPANTQNVVENDAISALVNLGFGRAEAYAAVARVASNMDDPHIQDLISAGLKELSA